jgi:hypothetical protein
MKGKERGKMKVEMKNNSGRIRKIKVGKIAIPPIVY